MEEAPLDKKESVAMPSDAVLETIIQKTNEALKLNEGSQSPLDRATIRKLLDLHPAGLLYRTNEKGEPIAWLTSFPTTRALAQEFLQSRITERQLLERTEKQESIEAMYLDGGVVLPEYRRQGLMLDLTKEAVAKMAPDPSTLVFCWAYTEEGKRMSATLEAMLGRPVVVK